MKIAATVVLVLIAASAVAIGTTISVSCIEGQADYTDLGLAMEHAGPDDVIVVYPCVYHVDQDWFVPICGESPDIIGLVPPGEVVIQGDGNRPALFLVADYFHRVSVRNITFRGVSEVLYRELPGRPLLMDFRNNRIEECGQGLDASYSSPNSVIAHNVITGNSGDGIDVTSSAALIESNEVCSNAGAGIAGSSANQCEMRSNHIHHNDGCGIAVGQFLNAHDNLVEHNGIHGLSWHGGGSDILGNAIRWNAGSGVYIESASGALGPFVANDIYGNGQFEVEVSSSAGAGSADFRGNWWGTTDPGLIAERIRDCADDSGIALCVSFEPPCDAPGCQPTFVRPVTWGTVKALYR